MYNEGTLIGIINIIFDGSYVSVPKLSTVLPANIQSPLTLIIMASSPNIFTTLLEYIYCKYGNNISIFLSPL
jgi:hypothetical protein